MIRAEFAIETGTRTTDVVMVGPKVADGAWERVGAVRTEARVVDTVSAVGKDDAKRKANHAHATKLHAFFSPMMLICLHRTLASALLVTLSFSNSCRMTVASLMTCCTLKQRSNQAAGMDRGGGEGERHHGSMGRT